MVASIFGINIYQFFPTKEKLALNDHLSFMAIFVDKFGGHSKHHVAMCDTQTNYSGAMNSTYFPTHLFLSLSFLFLP